MSTEPNKGRWWRLGLAVSLVVLALGIAMDACSGLSLSRNAASWPKWLAGVMALGALELLGEGAGEWLWSSDAVTDPLLKRVPRLATALFLCGVFLLAIWLIQVLVTR
jgi:hypothetical protein